jgi:hypothetical protein
MAFLRRRRGDNSKESTTKWFNQNRGSRLVTVTLHALLWFSVAAIVLSGVMLLAPLDSTLVPAAVLMIAAVCNSGITGPQKLIRGIGIELSNLRPVT